MCCVRDMLISALSPLGELGNGIAGGEGAIYLWARLPKGAEHLTLVLVLAGCYLRTPCILCTCSHGIIALLWPRLAMLFLIAAQRFAAMNSTSIRECNNAKETFTDVQAARMMRRWWSGWCASMQSA